MNFKFDFGYAMTAFTALVFYFRVAMLRGRKRRLAREELAEVMRMAKGKRQKDRMAEIEAKKGRPSIEIRSWLLIGIGILLMFAGIIFKNYPDLNLPQTLVEYWWAGPSLGFIIFIFAIK
ncbi:MAG: hypothetical protein CVU41_11940 [Chloroflexi bacterium HGW-Chloroflexi-3]|nr:MAG: hypothetical protein CVU41_11940 [Chloroflexi bacterium HGW-Chloroflexi-3]